MSTRLESNELVDMSRLPSLTGLRWIAAMMVFATHVTYQPGMLPEGAASWVLIFVTSAGGYVGVGFFFILSGFVLTWSMRQNDTAKGFWRRRFFKIYPNHFVTFLLALVLLALAGPALQREVVGVAPNLFLIHAWWPDLDVAFGGNDVSWTLSVEALFYLSFPLLIALIRRIRAERLWFWAVGLMGAVFCVPFVAKLLPDQPQLFWSPTPQWEYWFIYVFPPARLFEFALGIVLARIVLAGKWPKIRVWFAAVCVVVGYAVSLFVPLPFGAAAVTVIPLALLIAAAAAADINGRNGRRSFLGSRVMVWLGNISYAFYLLHTLVLYTMFALYGEDFRPNVLTSIGLVVFALTASILLSWVLYKCVELPIQRRFSTGRKAAAKTEEPVVGQGM